MKNELFPYQKVGAEWLAERRTGLLADEMRLGKTIQSITAMDIIGAMRVLIVCRGISRANWRDEFLRWSPREWDFSILFGKRTAGFTFRSERPHAIITSYECLDSVLEKVGPHTFDVAVVDESHYVKSVDAKRANLVFGRGNLPAKTKRLFALTGTPMPNGLASELWTLLFTFGATKLSYWDFAKKFCVVVDNGFGTQILRTKDDPATLAELQAIMAKKVLRRTASEVSVQLPKMSFSTVMVPPGRVDLAATTFWKWVRPIDRSDELNALLEKELGIVEGVLADKTLSQNALEVLKAQAKSISTLRRYTALQKLEAACSLIVDELEANAYRKCVIFAHHRDCIVGAQQYLHKFYPVSMYGGSNPVRLERNLKNFQNPKHKTRVFIGQISAAGTSISLSAANHIFFLEESFVPGDNMQAAMRCGGVNQTNPIFVRTFCLENSVDQRVQEILREKMNAMSKIYGGLTPAAAKPTNTESTKSTESIEDLF